LTSAKISSASEDADLQGSFALSAASLNSVNRKKAQKMNKHKAKRLFNMLLIGIKKYESD
jgi:hypothetical protein